MHPEHIKPNVFAGMRRIIAALLCGALLCSVSAVHGQSSFLVSEFQASNRETLLDEEGESSDWIEIYNSSLNNASIAGWSLTGDTELLDTWTFPDVEIPGQGFLIVFASGKDRAVAGSELHADFKLDRDGEFLALLRPDGSIASGFSPEYPRQLNDLSYGVDMAESTDVLIAEAGSARVVFPTDDSLGDGWTDVGFDDSGWAGVVQPIGYSRPDAPGVDPPVLIFEDVTQPGDSIVGTSNNSPGGEEVDKAIDDTTATKYLNFDELNTGFTVTPSVGQTVVVGLRLSSANDAPERDPTSYVLEGSVNGSTFTEIASGPVPQFSSRFETIEIEFENERAYSHYRLLFPTVRDANSSCCMQISEVEFLGVVGTGITPFEELISTNVEADMFQKTSSAYLRFPFTVAAGAEFDALALNVRYDDGFVTWLNGVEVASSNSPAVLGHDALATTDRSRSDAIQWQRFSLAEHAHLLVEGENVLAVHALNDATDGGDFLFQANLQSSSVSIGAFGYFEEPTPGEANAVISEGLVQAPEMDHGRGFYDEAFSLSIDSSTEDSFVRYTTDGSVPTLTNGADYSGPITISETTPVRAVAFRDGWRASDATTHTYIFTSDVVSQTRSSVISDGFPTSWNGQQADYGLDPRVVGANGTDDYNGKYTRQLVGALRSLPSMSLVIDQDDMFGPDGIYSNPNSRGEAWERETSLELIFPDGAEGFQEDAGIRVQGGAFRRFDLSLKKSFRLIFSEEHGATKLEYPLFGPDAVDEFDNFILRANSNDAWRWGTENALYVRDAFAQVSMREMGRTASHSRFVHLYINGAYWGLYNPVERPDASFSSSYNGGDRDDWDAINQDSAPDGNYDAWNRLLDLVSGDIADNAVYQQIQGNHPDGTRNPEYEDLLDVENMIDYMIMNFYVGNNDWPHRNFWVGRDRNDGDGFQFYPWDTETVMDVNSGLTTDRTGVNNNAAVPYGALRANAEFRVQFGDQVHRHFFNGGVFAVDEQSPAWNPLAQENNRPAARMAALADPIRSAIIAESARWGDQLNFFPYTRDEHWETELDYLYQTYFPQRSGIVLQQLRNAGLYPNLDAPTFNQHGGAVAQGFQLSMSAPAGTVFYTTDGTDPRSPIEINILSSRELIFDGASKRVFIPKGSNGGPAVSDAWRGGSAFDDSGWIAGTGGVGYENSSGYENFIDIDVQNEMSGESTSAFIRVPFTMTASDIASINFLTLSMRYDDGFAAYLNGELIASANAPVDPDWASGATGQNDDAAAVVFTEFDVTQRLEALRSGQNVLAIHGLNLGLGSSDFLIDVELIGGEREVIGGEITASAYTGPVALNDLVTVKARALNAGEWSALNEATFVVGSPQLVISELNYHPAPPTAEELGLGFNDGDDFEFIELHNPGTTSFDLTGVCFSDGVEFDFADATISELGPGEYALIVRQTDAFAVRFGMGLPVIGDYSGGLSNAGERVAISGADGDVIFEVTYGITDPWPATALSEGRSLVLNDFSSDPTVGASWRASANVGGDPGREANGVELRISSIEVIADELKLSFPAEAGVAYEVRSLSEIGGTSWSTVQVLDPAAMSGDREITIDIAGAGDAGFFQIVRGGN